MTGTRLHIEVSGMVQGVGFRPFIHHLATELGLTGWVCNTNEGASIEVEGRSQKIATFLKRLPLEKPEFSEIHRLKKTSISPLSAVKFEILTSQYYGNPSTLVLPDLATCQKCIEEVFNPSDRRFLYPFTNCTHCGPRYTILRRLPYDRQNTSMAGFNLCNKCLREYEDPWNRRFHAQPLACPDCGPRLEFWDLSGRVLREEHDALLAAQKLIRDGGILALKGLGGFLLLCDALSDDAVQKLRERKLRDEKPMAVMVTTLEQAKKIAVISGAEKTLLCSPSAPIVLLKKRRDLNLSSLVAPKLTTVGIMLPYTPLHHILMVGCSFPVVATSGNLSEEPLCIDENDALSRLGEIADGFLIHNRPILRPVDDSVVRQVNGRALILRRARGYAPLPILLKDPVPPTMAVGSHMKNTVAVACGREVFLSPHIGDLETEASLKLMKDSLNGLQGLFKQSPSRVVCDSHPDYASSIYAQELKVPVVKVQHHHAHVLSVAMEHGLDPPFLGVAWDGTGYGIDGTIWGGEFFAVRQSGIERIAHLRTFPLPGGEIAVREPVRAALGLLWELNGGFGNAPIYWNKVMNQKDLDIMRQMLGSGFNSPLTSSVGRLFDAVASILNLRQATSFEGQAAMELEDLAEGSGASRNYEIKLRDQVLDWEPLVNSILLDMEEMVSPALISACFHDALARSVANVAVNTGLQKVVLSGGCFQNRRLLVLSVRYLKQLGYRVFWPWKLPPNDGGIALGQIGALRFRS
jgi:hydrogenase maturation protein HypF